MIGLQAKEEARREAEIPGQPQIGIRRDRSLAEHDLVDPARRDAHGDGERGLAKAQRAEEVFQQISPGVGLGSHSTSVIIDDLDIGWTSFPPNKADLPLVIDANRILPRPLALQRFKAIARRNTKIARAPEPG